MYTLEKHLTTIAAENPQYNILLSIWNLNKSGLPLAQSNIVFNFPHYSLHERSHSDTIVKNIESFLGEGRIKNLSPTDTWLLLMSAHTHDLGMVVFHKALEEKWVKDDFQEYLENLANNSRDIDLTKAACLLRDIQNQNVNQIDRQEKLLLPLEIRKATILITSDYFRKIHHQRSREMIVGADIEFNKLISNFNLDQLPNRFANILGEIAYSHGIDFYSVLNRLEYQSNGFTSDKMHPRFIAYMLRLGDLLDVDDKRFNIFSEKVFANELPKISGFHKEKHASTKHLLITPYNIEVTVDCKNDEVYRVAREWFDWLQSEVEYQAREWSNIAPEDLTGLPPSISKGKLKVLYKNAMPKDELMNLRFSISNEKIFEMLEGSAIYENPGAVFIREIVQNALDAAKIQMWKDILNGNYNSILKRTLDITKDLDTVELVKSIKFPVHISNEIYENYQINLNIYWDEPGKDNLIFDLIDKGTGISEADLIRMTVKVGESRTKNKEFISLKKGMPFWLKPTGAFGIGLQSLFLVTKKFTIQTKCSNEEAKEIDFYSSKNGDYCRITGNIPSISRGTRIIFKIHKNKFDDIFGYSLNHDIDIHRRYDYFTDKLDNEYLRNINSYIEKNLFLVDLLNVDIANVKTKVSKYKEYSKVLVQTRQIIDKVESEFYLCYLVIEQNEFYFEIYERFADCGSIIKIRLPETIDYHSLNVGAWVKYVLRDIPISNVTEFMSYETNYLVVEWNLQNPDSDKLLNISRDRMIRSSKGRFDKIFLDVIIKNCFIHLIYLFEKNYDRLNLLPGSSEAYFFLKLSADMNQITFTPKLQLHQSLFFDTLLLCDERGEEITVDRFFDTNSFYIVSESDQDNYFSTVDQMRYQKAFFRVKEKVKILEKNSKIIFGQSSFRPYLSVLDYHLTAIQNFKIDEENSLGYRKELLLQILKIGKGQECYVVEVDEVTKRNLLANFFNDFFKISRNSRNIMYSINPYGEIISVNNIGYNLFSTEPFLANSVIISPFTSKDEVKEIETDVLPDIETGKNDLALEKIKERYLEKIIPQKLIDWIIQYNCNPNRALITKEAIIRAYADMLFDHLCFIYHPPKEE